MSNTPMSQSTSVAALRKAEKQAVDKINEARKRKQRRLKQAKEEAKSEIDALKEELDADFQRREMETVGNKDQFEIYVEQMMGTELEKLDQSVTKNETAALRQLLDAVLNIEPSLHQNFKC